MRRGDGGGERKLQKVALAGGCHDNHLYILPLALGSKTKTITHYISEYDT